jgi:hypothetical protein
MILHEFERRNEQYRRELKKEENRKKCQNVISKFDESIKNALNSDKSLNSFSVKFPDQCMKEVKQYLSEKSISVTDNQYTTDSNTYHANRILFQYSDNTKSISAVFYESCIDPVNLQ